MFKDCEGRNESPPNALLLWLTQEQSGGLIAMNWIKELNLGSFWS